MYIEVFANGSKLWRLKYRKANPDNPSKQKEDRLAFGKYPAVSLKDARQLQAEAKELINNGIDPKEYQRQQVAEQETSLSFKNVAMQWFESRKADTEKWSELYASKTLGRMNNHIFPHLNSQSVQELNKLLDYARTGDIIIVSRLDKVRMFALYH